MAKILVVDDDQNVRTVLKTLLEYNNHEVTLATNGNEGIKKYKEEKHDLILLDIIMPEKEGLETIIELKRDYPDVKIIAISGGGIGGPMDYLEMAELFGALKTIDKPFFEKDVINAIAEVLGE